MGTPPASAGFIRDAIDQTGRGRYHTDENGKPRRCQRPPDPPAGRTPELLKARQSLLIRPWLDGEEIRSLQLSVSNKEAVCSDP